MNFKEWLLTELSDLDRDHTKWMRNLSAVDLLYNREFTSPRAFIYSVKYDKLYIGKHSYHEDLMMALPQKDRNAADFVYQDIEWGVVGRIADANPTVNMNHVIPNDETTVAFYEMNQKHMPKFAKRSVELLLEQKYVTPLSFVIADHYVYSVTDYLGLEPAPEVVKPKDGLHLLGDEKRIAELQKAYNTGVWSDGRDLTKPERDYIKKQLDAVGSKTVSKNPWQAALEKNKLITPGTNFRTPYSDATNYEL